MWGISRERNAKKDEFWDVPSKRQGIALALLLWFFWLVAISKRSCMRSRDSCFSKRLQSVSDLTLRVGNDVITSATWRKADGTPGFCCGFYLTFHYVLAPALRDKTNQYTVLLDINNRSSFQTNRFSRTKFSQTLWRSKVLGGPGSTVTWGPPLL